MNTPLVVAEAVAEEQAASTRRRLRRKLVLWTVVTVVMVGLTAALWTWVESVTAWEDTIRSEGAQASAIVLKVFDDSGKRADDRVVLGVMGEHTQLVMHHAQLAHYPEGSVVTVWFDRSKPERVATEWDTNTTNRGTTVSFVALLVGMFTVYAGGRWAWYLRAIRLSSRGEAYIAVVTNLAVLRIPKLWDRTLVSFEDARGPWFCRQDASASVFGEVTVIATDKHRVVCTDPPFVLRRAWWGWTRRRWLKRLKTTRIAAVGRVESTADVDPV